MNPFDAAVSAANNRGTGSAVAGLTQDVQQLAPLATSYHTPAPAVPLAGYTPPKQGSQGVLPAFWGKVESVGKETGSILHGATSFLGHTAEEMVKAPGQWIHGVNQARVDGIQANSLKMQSQRLSDQMDTLMNSYKTGRINGKQYTAALKVLTDDSTSLQHDLTNFQSSTSIDEKNFTKAAINVAGDVVTVMTVGLASPAVAASTKAATAALDSAPELAQGAATISKLATYEAAWKAVSPFAQQDVKMATTQVLEAAGKQATAQQISKAVATNLLLKYPLTYNAISSTGQQVYDELNQNKYGDAVKTIAFNAALLFSGGPIGWGLKKAGKLAKGTSIASGLRPGSILDELSSRIGTGDRRALAQIAADAVKNGNEADVRSMIVALESNLARANGNPAQAINYIQDHLENYVSWGSLKNMTHQQVWDNLVSYFKHAEGLQELKKSGQIADVAADDARAVVPGRFTTADKNNIATGVTKGDKPVLERPAPQAPAATSTGSSAGQLPRDLRGAKPSYNYGQSHFDLEFEDDTTKALYVVAQSKASARDGDFMAFLREQLPGKSDAEIRALGQKVKDGIKADARTSSEDVIHVKSPASQESQSYSNTFGVDESTSKTELTTPTEQPAPTEPAPEPQTVEGRLAAWESMKQANPNAAWANNPNVDRQITQLIKTIHDPEALHKAINKIPTQVGLEGIPKDYAEQMAKDGYIAIVPKNHNLPVVPFTETSGKLATHSGEGDFFTKAAQPLPVLKSLGNFLTWAGLSPEVAGQRVGEVFSHNFAEQLSTTGFTRMAGDTKESAAADILRKISNYMKNLSGGLSIAGHSLPTTDMRQLSTKDIMRALDVTHSEAKDVQAAIMQAHLEVPRQITGLGPKILDYNFKYNPVAPAYSRVQGALRFAWNPIFTQGKLPIKAEILSQLQTGGKFPTIAGTNTFMKMFFPGQYKEIDGLVKDANFQKLMPHGFGGEGADITGVTEGGRTLNKNALRPVAGVIRSMADKMGIDTKTLMEQYPEQVTDAATAILHYDRKASFLNSPMAKTLNVAFFPFRFNVKVATFMAKALANQEPAIQYAIIKGTMDAHKFLNSPQGQAWYSQHSDAITLFKYFSPLETLSVVSNALGLKHDSTAQYGELGGLPFGWIPLMLDSTGITHFGQAYVNPKTGVIAKDYVPTSKYGAANAAIQDLLSSLYTYPGAEVGLPSKGKIDRTIVGAALPGSSKDFNAVDPTNVTPEEQQFSNTVQAANGSSPSVGPTQTKPQSQSVPGQSSAITVPKPMKSKTSSSGTKKATKKKGDFAPQLLPGQSQLGQL